MKQITEAKTTKKANNEENAPIINEIQQKK